MDNLADELDCGKSNCIPTGGFPNHVRARMAIYGVMMTERGPPRSNRSNRQNVKNLKRA